MAATVLFAAVALLGCASAQNQTSTFLLPNGLFDPEPLLQTFVGESSVTGHATLYTINCGNYNDSNFWPGPWGCADNNSYTFSADAANTQFLLPTFNLGQYPFSNTAVVPTWLENFNQTITINCAPLDPATTANCTWTTLYNNENANDKSIISPTIVTQSTYYPESSLYPVIFTAAAAAAATPFNSLAPSTTAAEHPISKTPPTSTPSTAAAAHTGLSSGAKAGIGVGVPLGVFALAGVALLLFAHGRHKRRSRTSQMESLVRAEGESGEGKRDEGVVVADVGGVYEMHSPVGHEEGPGELEG